ncbi:GNAT family N-acetyltransferase [Corynebacterium sp.]|uniref:N-acetylglutamate synthase, CG3035 family n=1 Tax=Corynebacterium sp. TaxID=1720 RepID=UPI001D1AC680|nr:GNAT family N-acetyltransferase [Corynebacterium sp.]MBS5997757.1 GNAT family N-acetyltransferase [Corynebacterium sp.]
MSRIFRSDAVQVGERVVARRDFGDVHSDVIGHVLSLNPLVIRPQEVGGYPSDLDAVEIPPEQLKIIKRLSPRMVRNSDIRAVEVAAAAASPGTDHAWTSDGSWLLRASDGVSGSSNSAVPLGPSAGFTPVPLEEIKAFYARHNLPVRLVVPERIGKPAERLLADPAWETEPEVLAMVLRDLPTLADAPSTSPTFHIAAQPDDPWLAMYQSRTDALPAEAVQSLGSHVEGTLGFGRLVLDGETVAIARGILSESGDGTTWLGLSFIEVAKDFRRRGYGTLTLQHLLHWGRNNGAEHAYLTVPASNTAGVRLAEKLGFIEQHRRIYACLRN